MQKSGMLLEACIGLLGGVFGGILIHAGLARKVYTLQCDVATVQEQLLREKNQRAALTRHQGKADLELIAQAQQTLPIPKNLNPLAKFGISR